MRTVSPHGAVETYNPENGNEFKINGQRIKLFLKSMSEKETIMGLFDPMYR